MRNREVSTAIGRSFEFFFLVLFCFIRGECSQDLVRLEPKQHQVTSRTKVKRVSRIHHRTILKKKKKKDEVFLEKSTNWKAQIRMNFVP